MWKGRAVAGSAVTVFIDYQNLHMSAHEMWCAFGSPPESCLPHPVKVAEEIVANRAPGGTLTAIHVYRGRPDPRKEPRLTQATDRQTQAWLNDDPRLNVHRRPLRYPRDFGKPGCVERPREKGVDVQLAVDVVRMAIEREFEVGIVCTRDTDLLPAIEYVMQANGPHIEVATWAGATKLKASHRGKRLWCHELSEVQWGRSIDRRAY